MRSRRLKENKTAHSTTSKADRENPDASILRPFFRYGSVLTRAQLFEVPQYCTGHECGVDATIHGKLNRTRAARTKASARVRNRRAKRDDFCATFWSATDSPRIAASRPRISTAQLIRHGFAAHSPTARDVMPPRTERGPRRPKCRHYCEPTLLWRACAVSDYHTRN